MIYYFCEGKYVFMELVWFSKSVDFYVGVKDIVEEIVVVFGEMVGVVCVEGFKEVIMVGL